MILQLRLKKKKKLKNNFFYPEVSGTIVKIPNVNNYRRLGFYFTLNFRG
jgi:hypothetical protein